MRGIGAADGSRRHRSSQGQVLVVFALAIIVLLAAAGLAIDIGRFYGERRFLQNAADAAALAAANSLSRGESTSQADAAARDILTRNFAVRGPNGVAANLPPTTPEYAPGHAGDPAYLTDGILISGGEVRVAVKNRIDYLLGRVVGLGSNDIGAQARTRLGGNLLPIAVRHWVNAPGPNSGATAPCPGNQSEFMDFFSTENTSCLGTDTNGALRSSPNAGSAFDSSNPESDPVNHGPVVAILGQGAQANNPADFRGFIALDIRNFTSGTSQAYYNGVTAGTGANTLKSMESNWILKGGYPGPAFPPVTSPADPYDQVATMSGNSTGIAIDAMLDRYKPGDEILVAVYSGTVNAVPDFSLTAPTQITVPTTGTASAATLKVSRNDSFAGQVTLSTLADTLDPTNPMVLGTLVGGAAPITYTPNPVTPATNPGTNVSMTNVSTSGAATGIYVLWIRAEAGSPYLTVKRVPISLVVGTVSKSFSITSDAQIQTPATVGGNVVFNLTLKNAPVGTTNFGGNVALSVDAPLPAGVGAVTFGSSTVNPSKNGTSTTLTINTATLAPGRWEFDVRASGVNTDATPHRVTQVLPVYVDIPPILTGNNPAYIDIQGFAVVRITSIDSNTVSGYAITPVIANMNDPQLRRGQVARLVPWN